MAKGQKNDDVLYRSVKFAIHPTPEQEKVLWQISANLREVWNQAVSQREEMYEQHLKPIYEQIAQARKEAEAEGYTTLWESKMRRVLNKKLRESEIPAQFISRRDKLLLQLAEAFQTHKITLFDQINALTPLRKKQEDYRVVPRNWQEETLDTVNAGFTSFMALRKKGDPDARPPRLRDREDFFVEIPGRYGFKIRGNTLFLNCGKLNTASWAFPIPDYQQSQIARWNAVKKFTLFRNEKDRKKPGTFWVALAGSMKKPAEREAEPTAITFLAPGTSMIGVCSPRENFVIQLWRPDKHWKPKIEATEARLKTVTKDSRKYQKLLSARRTMFSLMSRQQKQDHREIVSRLLTHGIHFVVPDIVIRSKEGKLADSAQADRRGSLGLNWMAQNTGGIAELIANLEEKVKEFGGSVRRFKPLSLPPRGMGEEHKVAMAKRLKTDFLSGL